MKNGEETISVRTKDISAFGIIVSVEETLEERKQRLIDNISRHGDPYAPEKAACVSANYIGSGLLG